MDTAQQPMDLPQALQEIERLRSRLALAEQTIQKLLPPLPPELQYLEGASVEELLANSTPMDVALAEIFAEAEKSRE